MPVLSYLVWGLEILLMSLSMRTSGKKNNNVHVRALLGHLQLLSWFICKMVHVYVVSAITP